MSPEIFVAIESEVSKSKKYDFSKDGKKKKIEQLLHYYTDTKSIVSP